MSEKSTTPDLVERTRRGFDAGSRRDVEAVMSDYGPESVWDMSPVALGAYEGQVAIRRFFEDWWGSYREYRNQVEEILDLGNGVIFSVVRIEGRPVGSDAYTRLRYAGIGEWVEGVIRRTTNYTDIDAARAAAERLAESRGRRSRSMRE
jgi:ketosteroid isomerase-like protein